MLGDVIGQAAPEALLDAHEQLDALEAAQAEVAVERRPELRARGDIGRAQLGQDFPCRFEDAALDRCRLQPSGYYARPRSSLAMS